MLRKHPPGVWLALLCTKSDGHHCADIGRHQRVGGGKPAHAGDALQTTIDRHGHLDHPHRGREASSSRSVALPGLGGENKEQGTSVSYYMTHSNVVISGALRVR